MKNNKIFYDYAPEYRDYGLSVIPVSGKAPLIKNWSQFCLKQSSDEVFEGWLEKYPNANIGLCLGPASGLMAFDYDFEDISYEELILGMLPKSPLIKVGKKGWTAFYKYSDIKSQEIKHLKKHIADFLSVGRQTVIPPSIHPDTQKPYVWLHGGRNVTS